MPPEDETVESAPAKPGWSLFSGRARDPETAGTGPQAQGTPAAPAKAKRARRQMPESTKRLLLIVAGVFVLVASVLGFYLTSDAFDERVPVLVAARAIERGEAVTGADFGIERAVIGSIPHVEGTPVQQSLLEGVVAVQAIPAGALVRHEMFTVVETAGVQLEVVVPLDLRLATDEISEGDEVLLVDPGVEPAAGDDGRPRRVVRQFELTGFDGAQMQLFLPPEEWAQWEALLEEVGGTLMVVDLGVGDDGDETSRQLDAVWLALWAEAVEEIALAVAAAEPRAGPGELEVIVSFDDSLVPSGVDDGDLVLLIDPGQAPDGGDAGRPRSVLQTLRLDGYIDGRMRMFLPPDEWAWWRSLPEQLGGVPQVLPVADGTDVDEMIERLDAVWEAAWRNAVAGAIRS